MRLMPSAVLLICLGLPVAQTAHLEATASQANCGALKGAAMLHEGIVDVPSIHSVDETVVRLKALLQEKHITLFALVDHSGEAGEGGDEDAPHQTVDFWESQGRDTSDAGCSLHCHRPASKDHRLAGRAGEVWLSYNSPKFLQQRHGLPDDLLRNVAIVGMLATRTGE